MNAQDDKYRDIYKNGVLVSALKERRKETRARCFTAILYAMLTLCVIAFIVAIDVGVAVIVVNIALRNFTPPQASEPPQPAETRDRAVSELLPVAVTAYNGISGISSGISGINSISSAAATETEAPATMAVLAQNATITPLSVADSAKPPQATQSKPYTDADLTLLAKTLWGEARGCTPDEQRLVAWCIFQRADATMEGGCPDGDWFGGTIAEVITKKGQFAGYRADNPVDEAILKLCAEEAEKWANGELPPTDAKYAPTVPYYYFDGVGFGDDGYDHNVFRKEWEKGNEECREAQE